VLVVKTITFILHLQSVCQYHWILIKTWRYKIDMYTQRKLIHFATKSSEIIIYSRRAGMLYFAKTIIALSDAKKNKKQTQKKFFFFLFRWWSIWAANKTPYFDLTVLLRDQNEVFYLQLKLVKLDLAFSTRKSYSLMMLDFVLQGLYDIQITTNKFCIAKMYSCIIWCLYTYKNLHIRNRNNRRNLILSEKPYTI
jgi:hypothetical protein